MQLDKKDLPKLAALGGLVVLCVCVVSFQFLRPNQAPPSPAAKQAAGKTGAAANKATTAGKTGAAEVASNATQPATDPAVMGAFPTLAGNPQRRDPFVPQIVEENKISRPAPAQPSRQSGQTMPQRNLRLPTGKVPPWNPLTTATAVPTGTIPASTAPAITVQPQDPSFVLTGVIRGSENVAIIRVGDKGRYVVKQGQIIEGRYRVLFVSDDTAVLADQNRRISVRLGGAKNGS